MSIEIWGSVWVLALVVLRRHSSRLALAVAIVSLVLARDNYLILFSIGHNLRAVPGLVAYRRPTPPFVDRGGATPGRHRIQQWLSFAYICGEGKRNRRNIDIRRNSADAGSTDVFNSAVPQYLGRLSFPIYLLHCPILSSAGSVIFLVALPLGHGDAVLVSFAVGTALTLGAAGVFSQFCDAPIVSLSRRLKNFGRMTGFIAAMRPKTLPS
jgi:hypothetical protein